MERLFLRPAGPGGADPDPILPRRGVGAVDRDAISQECFHRTVTTGEFPRRHPRISHAVEFEKPYRLRSAAARAGFSLRVGSPIGCHINAAMVEHQCLRLDALRAGAFVRQARVADRQFLGTADGAIDRSEHTGGIFRRCRSGMHHQPFLVPADILEQFRRGDPLHSSEQLADAPPIERAGERHEKIAGHCQRKQLRQRDGRTGQFPPPAPHLQRPRLHPPPQRREFFRRAQRIAKLLEKIDVATDVLV